MINRERRTNAWSAKSDQDSAVCARTVSPLHRAISSLQRNEYKRIYFNSPYDPTHLLYLPLIPSSLLITTRRLLTAAETASTCNFMKAFTVHATNNGTGCDRLHTLHTDVRPTTYVPCKCILVRDAHRAIPLRATSRPSSTFYFTPVRRPKSANKHSLRFLLSKRDRNNRVSFSVSYHFTIISHFFLPLPPFLSFSCFLFSSRVC